jgi:hypothetical protein
VSTYFSARFSTVNSLNPKIYRHHANVKRIRL